MMTINFTTTTTWLSFELWRNHYVTRLDSTLVYLHCHLPTLPYLLPTYFLPTPYLLPTYFWTVDGNFRTVDGNSAWPTSCLLPDC